MPRDVVSQPPQAAQPSALERVWGSMEALAKVVNSIRGRTDSLERRIAAIERERDIDARLARLEMLARTAGLDEPGGSQASSRPGMAPAKPR